MKVVFHEFFYPVYTSDPAAAGGRLEAIVDALPTDVEMVTPAPATEEQIRLAHTETHIRDVDRQGLYDISALAAGAAIETARIGLIEPAFGVIRPPGHHASSDSSWGFCYFNNMAIALLALHEEKRFETAMVVDIDLHFGDGTVNILQNKSWVSIYNIAKNNRQEYIGEIERILSRAETDLIGISAGFDNHRQDWGGLLATEDYHAIGRMTRKAARACGGGCFAILEGGYNHSVLGQNVTALINGMSESTD
ncbi:MAG: histone deacetylase family protein [Thermodesulfobacteriota bacterium]